jgi:hypothetical protein
LASGSVFGRSTRSALATGLRLAGFRFFFFIGRPSFGRRTREAAVIAEKATAEKRSSPSLLTRATGSG